MKALTVWQPWASLIMLGAKPYEFRRWDYRIREKSLVDKRIAIHAGARPIKREDVLDIMERLEDSISSLNPDLARPLCQRILDSFGDAPKTRRRLQQSLPGFPEMEMKDDAPPSVVKPGQTLPLSALLGTVRIGEPKNVTALFSSPADSDRLDHHMWGWPMLDIQRFDAPVPARGAQGFWEAPQAAEGVTTIKSGL